jgi:hypothetical protein
VHVEKLPDSRLKTPISIRASYFAGDHLILRGYYRYYQDDWGMTAHTISLEPVIKPTAFFSVSPFYRFYSQQATKYFAPYQQHTAANTITPATSTCLLLPVIFMVPAFEWRPPMEYWDGSIWEH